MLHREGQLLAENAAQIVLEFTPAQTSERHDLRSTGSQGGRRSLIGGNGLATGLKHSGNLILNRRRGDHEELRSARVGRNANSCRRRKLLVKLLINLVHGRWRDWVGTHDLIALRRIGRDSGRSRGRRRLPSG